jgi:multidrug transporter EmrE-like cation transporter
MMLYFYIACILVCETTAMSFLKEYSQIRIPNYFLSGLLFYTCVVFFLVRSFSLEGMGIVNVVWSAFSVIFVESVGVYKFHEKVTHTQIIGITCAILGVAILKV